jgi:hypothetical protein
MSAQAQGMKRIASHWTDDPTLRIATALETLAGCTGWIDEHGQRQHDDEFCPLHESQDDPVETEAEMPLTRLDRFRDWLYFHFGL